jgi:hypothetical protein
MSDHLSDFTRDNYRRLLRLAKKTYQARLFTNFAEDERFILWRHDLDFSMHAALRIARIEAEEGVCATYFLYPHSRFYNLLEHESRAMLAEMVVLGHAIGLHFDVRFHAVQTIAHLEQALKAENAMLRDLLGVDASVFSFHDTDQFTDSCRDWRYAGMINTYAQYFRQQVGYVSDSNGIWRHRRLEHVLTQPDDYRLQVLTHPAWWQDTAMSPRARVEHCIAGRSRATADFYDRALAMANRPNIGVKK